MIVCFENGRLGNQLFQYAALRKLYPNCRIVLFGFGALKQGFESVEALVFEEGQLSRWLVFVLKRTLFGLAKFRIIGTIQEFSEDSNFFVKKFEGVFSIYLLKSSFFQHQEILDNISPALTLSRVNCCKASCWLKHKLVKLKNQNLIFMHVRRGDYVAWPSHEFPAVLEKQWYCRALEVMRERVNNPIFILLTDDSYYAKDCFGDQPDILISENDQLVDFALMSLCQHGILSASSFAWWGAFYARSNINDGAIFLAPKYWAGHRSRKWVPAGFRTNWITYVE